MNDTKLTAAQANMFPQGRWAPRPEPRVTDTSNVFGVLPERTHRVDAVRITLPVPDVLSRDLALNLAAWLQTIADPGGEEIAAMVKQIQTPPR